MIDFEKIKMYREQINELLKEHPELEDLQKQIDESLKKAGSNKHERCRVIQEIMLNTWFKITKI